MKNDKIKGFSLEGFVPSWPSSVMGTGILSVALALCKKAIPFFYTLSIVFAVITYILLALVFGIWVMRLIKHPRQFYKELHHPVAGSFLPTMPIAFMIAGIDMLLLGTCFYWATGSCIHCLCCVYRRNHRYLSFQLADHAYSLSK